MNEYDAIYESSGMLADLYETNDILLSRINDLTHQVSIDEDLIFDLRNQIAQIEG